MSLATQLRRPIQITAGIAALFGIPIFTGSMLGSGTGSYVIMAVMFGSLLTFGSIFWLILRFWKRKKGSALSKALRKDAFSQDLDGIESIRSNFEEGMDKMRRAGKNVYDLPWFLLAGQAGAGKTEAIRRSHSKEDFPPGLNDLMQGVGGTLNMNWWFTNKAIILDTAGRIFEEKVVAGQTNEWTEFLKLLRRSRKNMPINGFILAIPADSLICDNISGIEQKASHIAAQLTRVQDTLGVRFPVFVIVTKSDFIPGFREFVGNVAEPRFQQQMLGWSNPQSLDEPFVPEKIDSYLEGMVEKLKKRRLAYMLDPRPQGKKRLDELDSLFTFPNHLREIVPNLRRYLEIVFALNPWSQKPLFIRGIYFTSSLQQGEALDEALASVLGKDLGQMALSSFKKETALFLRDPFFSKIYKEYGLVTSARKVGAAMRRRTALFSLVSLSALFGILGAAWFGSRSFQEQVGVEYAHWNHAATELDGGEVRALALRWRQPIVFDPGTGVHFTSNWERTFAVAGSTTTLPDYLLRLGDFAESELAVPTVFRPFRFFDEVFVGDRFDRRTAFRNVFEAAVIFPIIENAGDKLRMTELADWDSSSVDGLRSMVRLQMLLNVKDRRPGFSAAFFRELEGLHIFLVGQPLGNDMKSVFLRFFGDEFVQQLGWPSERFAPLYAPAQSLNDPRMIGVRQGIEIWSRDARRLFENYRDDLQTSRVLLQDFEVFGRDEEALVREATRTGLFPRAEMDALESRFDRHLHGLTWLRDFGGDPVSFASYYRARLDAIRNELEGRAAAISREIESFGSGPEDALAAEILADVFQRHALIKHEVEAVVDADWLSRMETVDRDLIGSAGFSTRLRLYRSVSDNLTQLDGLVLTSRRNTDALIATAEQIHEEIHSATGVYRGHLETAIRDFRPIADARLEVARDRFADSYCRFAREDLGSRLGFPVIRDGQRILRPDEITDLSAFAGEISRDTLAFASQLRLPYHAGLTSLAADAQRIDSFIRNHLSPSVLGGSVRFSKPPLADSLSSLGRQERLAPDAVLRQSVYWRARFVQLGDNPPQRIGRSALSLGRLALDANRVNIAFTSVLDGRPGDSGGFIFSGDWAPLRLILSSGSDRDPANPTRYRFYPSVRAADGREWPFVYWIDVPDGLPTPDSWLSRRDLQNF